MSEVSLADRKLMGMLRDDPLASTRTIAAALDVSEKTILNRIKALRDNHDLKITGQWDMKALGLNVVGVVLIDSGKEPLDKLVLRLGQLEAVRSVAELASSPALIAYIVVRTPEEFYAVVHEQIAGIKEVKVVDVELASSTLKYSAGYALGAGTDDWRPCMETLSPVIDLDDLDLQMTGILQDDGRTSHREVARRLDISESAVRKRLQKLQKKNAFKKVAVINPLAFDYGAASAIRITVPASEIEKICSYLAALEEVVLVLKVISRYNLHFVLMGGNHGLIAQQVRELIGRHAESADYTILPYFCSHKHSSGLVAL